MQDFTHAPMLGHITTFGGNPLSAVAASAVIQLLRELPEGEVEEKGKFLENMLQHERIHGIRRRGLMLAVDLKDAEELSKLIDLCREEGVIIYRFLSHPHSFRISPPLNITRDDLREGGEIILKCLDRL